jgi:hypothetical protein
MPHIATTTTTTVAKKAVAPLIQKKKRSHNNTQKGATAPVRQQQQQQQLWTIAQAINVWYALGQGECAEDYTLQAEELLARGDTDVFAVSRDGAPLEQLFRDMHARLEEDSQQRRSERRSKRVIRDLQAQVLRIAALVEAEKTRRLVAREG